MELVFLQLVIDAARSDADQPGHFRLISAGRLKNTLKKNLLAVFERLREIPAVLSENSAKVGINIVGLCGLLV